MVRCEGAKWRYAQGALARAHKPTESNKTMRLLGALGVTRSRFGWQVGRYLLPYSMRTQAGRAAFRASLIVEPVAEWGYERAWREITGEGGLKWSPVGRR